MNNILQEGPLLRILLGGACAVIIVAGMKAISPLLNIVFVSWLLAYCIAPLPNWLMRKRVPSSLAVMVTFLIVVFGGLGIAYTLGLSIAGLIQKLPTYQTDLTNLRDSVISFLASKGIHLGQIKSLDAFEPARLVKFAGSVLGGAGQVLGNVLLLIFLVIILLFEFTASEKKLETGQEATMTLLARFREASRDVKKYVTIVGGTGLIQAIANVILLAALGVDFAVTWGVLFFFLNFIPAIGFLLALIPPALVCFLELGWKTTLAMVIGYYVINFVGDNIVKPKFMKKGLDVSILLIILSLIFWSWVLGSLGAILAVPLTMFIKNLFLQIGPSPVPSTMANISDPAESSNSEGRN
jgi:predicted PurR-regulated permease PerM